MFVRVKRVGDYQYLQVVENLREGKKTRQRVVGTLGRLDHLRASGNIEVLIRSLGRFAERVSVQEAHARGDLEALGEESVGSALILGRLWEKPP
ncbi:MAG: hypothetical protein ACOZCF_08615 [Bacillota bacterium]